MNALTRLAHLPLVVKELLEQAARPRTYSTRVAYGAMLYLVVVVLQAHFFEDTGNIGSVLGAGRDLFETLVIVQFAGILVFLPALMCGRITGEKERDSLGLLLLTDLSPAQIVLQKYVAGLVPMLTFLLLGLPLAAVAYAFGGFPPRDLALAAATLLLACLQLGALALWCSALCRNTVAAFVATYALAALLYLGPIGGGAIVHRSDPSLLPVLDPLVLHVPPGIFYLSHTDGWTSGSDTLGAGVTLATTLLFLLLATWHLPRRALAPPAQPIKRMFEWLDRASQWANRLAGNIVIGRAASALPGDAPVFWRERRCRLLGRPAYLVRLLFAVEVPVLLLVRYLAAPSGGQEISSGEQLGLSVFAAGFGAFGVLALSVVAANTFATERVNQTLEVLLTTPIAARNIVGEKARALDGLVLVVAVPLLTIFGYEWVLRATTSPDPTWIYAGSTLLTIAVYLPLVKWLGLWIGLATRTRLRAIAATTGTVVGWCALPLLLSGVILAGDATGQGSWLLLTSPLTIPAANEDNSLNLLAHGPLWVPVLVNFALYGVVLFSIRAHCLEHADEYLRR